MNITNIGLWRHSDNFKERKKKHQDEIMLNFKEEGLTVLSLTSTHMIYKQNERVRTIERYSNGQSVEEFVAKGLDYLPLPVENSSTKTGEQTLAWLEKLEDIEKMASEEFYKGFSYCRICDCENGSSDFAIFDHDNFRFIDFMKDNTLNPENDSKLRWFVWPSGYKHYIKEHNIEVDETFWNLIEKQF